MAFHSCDVIQNHVDKCFLNNVTMRLMNERKPCVLLSRKVCNKHPCICEPAIKFECWKKYLGKFSATNFNISWAVTNKQCLNYSIQTF